jgi:CheY-like chemotaxis protein
VVLGIVQSHRGYITVESQPGQGSDFNVYLPVLSETSSFPATEPRAMTGGKESILVVDDEEIVVKVVGRMLVKLGYKIKTCTSSVEALNVFLEQQDRYDVLLTDLTMPNLTGLELAAEMRKRRSEIPIIIMTGFGSTLDEATRKSFGIKQVIGKPVVMSELDMALRNLLS